MTQRNILTAAAILMAGAALTSGAAAQTTAALPPLTQGPSIPGFCMMSVSQAIGTSAVGKFVSDRMGQIVAQVKAELGPEDTALATEQKALQAGRGSMDAAAFQARVSAFQARAAAFTDKRDLRQKEVQATEQKAFNRISQELDPVARQLYQQRKCSVLVDRGQTVLIGSPEMDLTTAAVAGLNARIQQFTFDREHLTPGAAAR
jgi:Skp family chaperone for outer membrane proteins